MIARSPVTRLCFVAVLVGWLGSDAADAQAYRFVCNSVDFAGIPSGDVCGPCSDDSAARWSDASVRLTWFPDDRPDMVSEQQMEQAIAGAASAWNEVSGCRFRFEFGRAAPEIEPSWGSVDDRHHLLWVSGPAETWEELTFTNPETTLALTAVRYFCDTAESPRTIYDADIALNNTGPAWQCSRPDCWRLEHALTHEFGHALGLGHACGACDTLLMVAQADPGFQPDRLFDDDRDGCRALYPDNGDPEPTPDAPPVEPAPETVEASAESDIDATPHEQHCGHAQGQRPALPLIVCAVVALIGWRTRTRRVVLRTPRGAR